MLFWLLVMAICTLPTNISISLVFSKLSQTAESNKQCDGIQHRQAHLRRRTLGLSAFARPCLDRHCTSVLAKGRCPSVEGCLPAVQNLTSNRIHQVTCFRISNLGRRTKGGACCRGRIRCHPLRHRNPEGSLSVFFLYSGHRSQMCGSQ